MTMFGTATNTMLILVVGSIRTANRTGTKDAYKRAAKAILATIILSPVAATGIDELRDKLYGRKGSSFWNKLLANEAGMVFILRDLVQSGLSKAERGNVMGFEISNPMMQLANLASDVLGDVWNIATSDQSASKKKKKALDAADKTAEITISGRYGLPYRSFKNMTKILFKPKPTYTLYGG